MKDTLCAMLQPELFPPGDLSGGPRGERHEELQAAVELLVRETLEDLAQPTAGELLDRIEASFGWEARWVFWETVIKLRHDRSLPSHLRVYLGNTLNDDAIRAVLTGQRETKDVHRSTLDDLFRRSHAYRQSGAFSEMIEFTAKFRDYAPYNNMLVKIQHPSCSFFATERDWRRRFDRTLKEDARPLIILAPMHPVMLVYDIDQTEGGPLPQKLLDFGATSGAWKETWMECLLHNAERDKIQVKFQPLSSTHGGFATTRLKDTTYKMRIAVHDGFDSATRFSILCHELAHIYLGHLGSDPDGHWPCRINLSHPTVEIEAEATAFIVSSMLGLRPASESYLSNFIRGTEIPETVSIELITKVAGRLEERARKKLPPYKQKGSKS